MNLKRNVEERTHNNSAWSPLSHACVHTHALVGVFAHDPSQMIERRLGGLKDGENQSSNEVSIGEKVCESSRGVGQ